ncbi:hypothetical protein H0H93_011620 [Arthromyces matolae]|nr:hypothetical protein H0H93_011620 [Arthromyces matolae]
MDNKDVPKARRPLPIPGTPPAQRPNTPTSTGALNEPVATSTFYGNSKAPPLPTRSHTIGSSHTTYVAPHQPPPYRPSSATGFREPELVVEEPTPPASSSWKETPTIANSWESNWNIADGWEQSINKAAASPAWQNPPRDTFEHYDPMAFMSTSKSPLDVNITGRDDYEEKNWWDPAVRDMKSRPGPGMIPTMLAEALHNTDHTLFSVLVSSPEIKNPIPSAASVDPSTESQPSASPARNAWATQSSQSASSSVSVPSTSTSAPAPPPPTDSDVRTAVPHPNAYYCPKENGWVILAWKTSGVSPPYAESFKHAPHLPLPDQDHRRRTNSCLENDAWGATNNKTHHFHKYPKAVDAHKLTPPFRMEEWEVTESVKQRRREQGIVDEDVDVENLDPNAIDEINTEEVDKEGRLLDLYICCQCSLYCVASEVIPGIIPRKCIDETVRDKKSNPLVGQTGEVAVASAFETIVRIIENKLWKGENRLLRTDRPQFRLKLGWSPNTKRTLEAMGFTEEVYENHPALRPPPTDLVSSVGRMNRRRLLRAWVEVNAWLADYRRLNANQFKDSLDKKPFPVRIESAREMYQTAIGAHQDQIPRGLLHRDALQSAQFQVQEWHNLGLTPTSFSADLLAFAYYAQVRCDPGRTIEHFTSLSNIVTVMQNYADCPQLLPEILATERSRDRFTAEDVLQAASTLGFGENNVLGVEYNEMDVPEPFLENAWRDCLKRSWRDPLAGAETLRSANDAFRILAEARGSETLRRIWESGKNKVMTPEKAYDTLEVPKDVDEFMLITVYNMRRLTGPQPTGSSVHEKEDLFSHLPVNVTEDSDIYDGLSGYFDDVVEFNGEKRRMEVTLVDLPPVLQIQLQRVQFNRETLQPYKSQAYVKFWETIYMDRFMDNADSEKKSHSKAIQSRLNTVRERLRLLVDGKDVPFLTAIENTATFVNMLGPDADITDEELRTTLTDEQRILRDEIDALRQEASSLKEELEGVWRDNSEIAYELTSVFTHRGSSPSFGHYFFYSRNLPNQPDSWFKYNDSDVTVVPKEEVLADTTGSTANPYLLVFARKGTEVVDTVKRFDPSILVDE